MSATSNLKPKTSNLPKGFTLIEMLVVISIMAIMATLLVINFNATRGPRNVKIAQSQMVTNIRKTQSYILSSRNINGVAPKFYMLRFDLNASQYVIQSIDSSYTANLALETIKLPQGITVSAITIPGCAGNCAAAQVAYASPSGKMYAYSASDNCAASIVTATQNPGCLLSLADRQVIISLKDQVSGTIKTVTMYGVSGTVVAN